MAASHPVHVLVSLVARVRKVTRLVSVAALARGARSERSAALISDSIYLTDGVSVASQMLEFTYHRHIFHQEPSLFYLYLQLLAAFL